MKIEVLGIGCANCKQMHKNVEVAVKELGLDAEILKVEDFAEIAGRGVMFLPALVIDGEIRVAGRVPSVQELKGILSGYLVCC